MAHDTSIPGPVRLDRTVDLDRVALHLSEWPGERGPLICLPGQTASGRSFDGLAAALAPAWRVLALDPRGRGRSGRPAHGYGYQVQVADTLALLDQFGFERVVLAGHSYGAIISLLIAAWYPDRVAGLILIDGGAEISPAVHAVVAEIVRRLDVVYPSVEAYLALLRQVPAFHPWTEETEAFFASSVEPVAGGVRARTSRAAVEQEIRAYLDGPPDYPRLHGAVRCPTLVIRAATGFSGPTDRVLPEDVFAAMLAGMPTARGVVAEGTNHYTVLIGKPEPTIRAVREFLGSLPNPSLG